MIFPPVANFQTPHLGLFARLCGPIKSDVTSVIEFGRKLSKFVLHFMNGESGLIATKNRKGKTVAHDPSRINGAAAVHICRAAPARRRK
jgi:hypothetical protein